MLKNLINKKIILASKSPRRQELLKGLGLSFEIKTKEINEDFPNTINNSDVGSSPKRNIAANKPVGGIPIVTIGRTLYKGLFFRT